MRTASVDRVATLAKRCAQRAATRLASAKTPEVNRRGAQLAVLSAQVAAAGIGWTNSIDEFGIGITNWTSSWSACRRWSRIQAFCSGMAYYESRLPCDATQIGRLRPAIGEECLEQLLKFIIQTAVEIKAIKPAELERVIVDSTV
jgi:hypothetical protein